METQSLEKFIFILKRGILKPDSLQTENNLMKLNHCMNRDQKFQKG